MNYIRQTRQYNYMCVNGSRTREAIVEPLHLALPANPRRVLSEEERAANRARAEEKREAIRLRREQEERAQEQLRNEAILAAVNQIVEERIEQVRAEFRNALPRNGEPEHMEVDDDECVLRIPEPFLYREVVVVEDKEKYGQRGANRMNGKLFGNIMFISNNEICSVFSVILKKEKPSVVMGANSTMKSSAFGSVSALHGGDVSMISMVCRIFRRSH